MASSGRPLVAEVLADAERVLAAAGCETPRLDAEVLFRHAAGGAGGTAWDAARLIVEQRSPADPAVLERFRAAVARRSAREPLAYVSGEREFWSRTFRVDSRVLVPRPETEEIVAAALRIAPGLAAPRRVIDVGTGSGVLAVTLALELGAGEGTQVLAIDRSEAALAVARENAAALARGAGAPILWIRGDLTTAVAPESAALVVANPPYLAPAELAAAAPELAFEPSFALLGGDGDGLGVVRRLLEGARRVLRPGGVVLSEIGCGQGAKVASLAARAGFEDVEVARDLAGRDRVLVARRPAGAGGRLEDPRGEGRVDEIVIRGGRPLAGTVRVGGAKNAALPILFASLLTEESCTIDNLPGVVDCRTAGRLLAGLGVDVETSPGRAVLRAAAVERFEAPYDLVKTMRASFLALGPLLARFGEAKVATPGGCAIGSRPVDLHLMGLACMGAEIAHSHGYVTARAPAGGLRGARVALPFPSVGATENVMLAAALARGTTVIENAAREPEITDLGRVLAAMGAGVRGTGSEVVEIEGRERLDGFRHHVIPDRIEAGTFLIAVAAAGGEVVVEDARADHLEALVAKLREAGIEVEDCDSGLRVRRRKTLAAVDVTTAPHPGFPTDLQAQFMALMCFADGQSTITETIFENRFMHVQELARMGADIRVEGARATVHGGPPLEGAPVMATDLRASVCLVVAALAAQNTTRLQRVYHLDRGYEEIEVKLSRLGADIERVAGARPGVPAAAAAAAQAARPRIAARRASDPQHEPTTGEREGARRSRRRARGHE
jgi:UDP-N-acetylglucosamine 1-carboxyvinyltransferase